MNFEILLQIIEPILLLSGLSQCPLCRKIMKERWMIKRHLLLHTGEKPYSCSLCPYASNQKDALKRHFNRKHCLKKVKLESE